MSSIARRLVAEGLGTALLVATVVGSGVMAERLTTDVGLQLFANALATGAVLVVLVTILGPISGAHLNPAVSFVTALRRNLSVGQAALYAVAQVCGAVLGTWLAHAMFGLPILQLADHVRTGSGQWLGEVVATFGLVVTIIGGDRVRAPAVPWLVGLYIVAAYWFTSSTSFANPAVTIARALTDSFAGIRPVDLPAFVAAQIAGALAAAPFAAWLWGKNMPADGAL